MNDPRASVVVCFFNRGDRASPCLESIAALEYRDFELVLVDDGSTDGTAEALAGFCEDHPELASTIVRHEENLGVSAARNSGIRAASGALVFFTDSDCEVETDWLGLLVDAFHEPEVEAVAGSVLNPPPSNWVERAYVGRSRGGGDSVSRRTLVGGNMGFRRQVLERFLFDEALQYGCDEDELAWRMSTEGCVFRFVADAKVLHRHPMTLRGYLDLARRQGRGSARFWYKKGVYFGRDVLFAVFGLMSLPLALLGAVWLVVPALFFVLQVVALLVNQAFLMDKGLREAIIVWPVEAAYIACKSVSVVVSLAVILVGGDPAIRASKAGLSVRRKR